jgi:6-phosphogluconolactonase
MTIKSFDGRRDLALFDNTELALAFAIDHWIKCAEKEIQQKGRFTVALSGGSTPNVIYQKLSELPECLDWSKVWLFWSDERSVPATHPDSNYHMAMQNGLAKLPCKHIFRMKAELDIHEEARNYEALLKQHLGHELFDLVMLGVGEDGHTASLFPNTSALKETDHLVVANYVPEKQTWRMTLTFPCINKSKHTVLYVLGSSKQEIVKKIFTSSHVFPSSNIGTTTHKALWIMDKSAAKHIMYQCR